MAIFAVPVTIFAREDARTCALSQQEKYRRRLQPSAIESTASYFTRGQRSIANDVSSRQGGTEIVAPVMYPTPPALSRAHPLMFRSVSVADVARPTDLWHGPERARPP